MKRISPSLVLFFLFLFCNPAVAQPEPIHYIALGDSYTIGTGVRPEEAWPGRLVAHLRSSGVNISMMNLARNGYATKELIEKELPVFEASKPNFATLLIGANDCARGVSLKDFAVGLNISLDRILKVLPAKERLIVVTIPDFSVTPQGSRFTDSENIRRFNVVIVEEARQRGLTVIDIFPVSQQMNGRTDLTVPDGLHPSAQEHLIWEELLYPQVYKTLSQ